MRNIFKCFKIKLCIIVYMFLLIVIFFIFPKSFILVGNYLNDYSSAIVALVAILGLVFGQSWLDTSKEKMRGKLDNDIARKYLKMVLQLRDAVKKVRNPFIPIDEMRVALEKNGFKGDEYEDKVKVNRSVYSLRWNNVQEAWTSFEEILVEAEVSWGNEAVNIQKNLDMFIRELRSVLWLFVNYSKDFNSKWEENNKIIYGTHDENDEFAKKVNSEIEEIRKFLKKYL